MSSDPWSPDLYHRFAQQRRQPFFDLLALVVPGAARVADLGCGTGERTRRLHEHVGARRTWGVDSSRAMLERATDSVVEGLSFEHADLVAWEPPEPLDLVFSHAALHWVDDHPALLARLADRLAPGGQLAVQVPANHEHVSHRVAAELAASPPFAEALDGWVRRSPVLSPQDYAVRLHELGFREPVVRAQVYLHLLPDAEALVTWMRGTTLTAYERRLPPALFATFVERYGRELARRLPPTRPLPFPFLRILMWARR